MNPARAHAPLWDAVTARAAGQCERTCTSRGKTTRCDRTRDLVVAPADPAIPEHAAWRVPAAELAAWCSPCLSDARRQVRARTARRRVIPGQIDLLAFATAEMSVTSGKTVTSEGEGVGTDA